MKQIQLKKNYIEIPLVNEQGETLYTFKFDKTDENVKKFFTVQDRINEINAKAVENDFEKEKDDLKELMDSTLGEGTFDEVYKLNPSIVIITGYLLAVMDYIYEDIRESQTSKILDKYKAR